MPQRFPSSFIDRFRNSLARVDAATALNEFVQRAILATVPTGNATRPEDIEACLQRVVLGTASPDGVVQCTMLGIPIRMVAELTIAALEEAVGFTVRLSADASGICRQDAQKYMITAGLARLVLKTTLTLDPDCVSPRRLFSPKQARYGPDSIREALEDDFDSLLTDFWYATEEKLRGTEETLESVYRIEDHMERLFVEGFAQLCVHHRPLQVLQSAYNLFDADDGGVVALVQQALPQPDDYAAFIKNGLDDVQRSAGKAFKSDDAKRAGSLWNAAGRLCAMANVEANVRFGEELVTWMQLGHAICQAEIALALDLVHQTDAYAIFEQIYSDCYDQTLPGVSLATCVGALLRRFGYESGLSVLNRLLTRCEELLLEDARYWAEAIAAFDEMHNWNDSPMQIAVHCLVSHRCVWRYPYNRENASERERLEQRTAVRRIFNELSEETADALRNQLINLTDETQLTPASREFVNDMREAFIHHAQLNSRQSKEVQRDFS